MITVWSDISELATLSGATKKDGRNLLPDDLGLISDAAIAFDQDKILWQGKSSSLPQQYQHSAVSLKDHVVTPEIVDSHTHLVFAGNRADEYKMRLDGADYQVIAASGGGILSTMNATKDADEEELFQQAKARIERIHSYGVGTIEIKSGYALTLEGERKLSQVIARLKSHFSPRVRIMNTFMAAHAVPKNFKSSKDYIETIVLPLLKELASKGIIDAVDIFHENGYFSFDDVEKTFTLAQDLGIAVKIHADEFGDNGGAALAVKHNALSADHLLCTGDKGIAALANSKTVCTLLPGTGYFLGKPQARARKLLDAGAKVAIASDFNPGSCHVDNILLLASLAAPNYKMNSAELWAAITINARDALGLDASPRFSIFKANSISEITYSWGRNFSVSLT
tara:strand:+ start:19396 stop:20586 length:1191 start_codon:yes stop_codon:yes gene_type:complete